MVHTKQDNSKDFAFELRKGGYSYSEIRRLVPVPKSTLSYWFRDLKLSEFQLARLKKKRLESARQGAKTKSSNTLRSIKEIQNKSSQDINNISKRDLWLMGIVLYWRERFLNKNDNDLRKGVSFTSSDQDLIKLFLKWLSDIGQISKEEIDFDIFINEDKKESLADHINYWSKVTGFSDSYFTNVYFQKVRSKKGTRNVSSRVLHGLLKIRVKSSSMLARQISGWIKGIREFYWDK